MLPMQGVNMAYAELVRCFIDLGGVGSFVRLNTIDGYFWHSKYWNPLFEMQQALIAMLIAGVFEFYPTYANDDSGLWLFHDLFRDAWVLSNEVNGSQYNWRIESSAPSPDQIVLEDSVCDGRAVCPTQPGGRVRTLRYRPTGGDGVQTEQYLPVGVAW